MDRQRFEAWLRAYLHAWNTHDPVDVGELFAEGATYWHGPFGAQIRGRDEIVRDWLTDPDPPGSWRAELDVIAVEDDVGVASGTVLYLQDGRVTNEWSNVFICRFDADGRCREHRMWCIRRP